MLATPRTPSVPKRRRSYCFLLFFSEDINAPRFACSSRLAAGDRHTKSIGLLLHHLHFARQIEREADAVRPRPEPLEIEINLIRPDLKIAQNSLRAGELQSHLGRDDAVFTGDVLRADVQPAELTL